MNKDEAAGPRAFLLSFFLMPGNLWSLEQLWER